MTPRAPIILALLLVASYAAAQPNDERYANSYRDKPKEAAKAKTEPVRHHRRARHRYEAPEPPKATATPPKTVTDARKPLKEALGIGIPDTMLAPKLVSTIRIFPEPIRVEASAEPVSAETPIPPQPEPPAPIKLPEQPSPRPPAGDVMIAGLFGVWLLAGCAGLWHFVRRTARRMKPNYGKPIIQQRRDEHERPASAWWRLHHKLAHQIARYREQRSARLLDQRSEHARSQLRNARAPSPSRPRRHDRHFGPVDNYPPIDSPLGAFSLHIRPEA